MKSRVELNNQTAFSVEEEVVFNVINKVVEKEGGDKDRLISVAFITPEEMIKANKEYREKDYITDVLSFCYNEEDILGEILICPEKIKQQSKEHNQSFENELKRMLIHGTLHLFGYTHDDDTSEQEMEIKTELYLKQE